MKRVLIVGRDFHATLEKIESLGHECIILKDEQFAKDEQRTDKRYYFTSFESREVIVNAAKQLPKIDGLIWTYENYVLPAAWIAQGLGLHGMPVESAESCTDKFLMRQLFAKVPEKISPDFATVSSEDDIVAFARSHQFPLILKPANLVKSLLVTKNNSMEELLINYRRTTEQIDDVYKKYAPQRTPKLLVEEFLEGPVHSVDAFVTGDGTPHVLENVVDYETGYDIGYEDNFHYSRLLPSQLSPEDQQAVRRCAELGIRALDMHNSPAHVEIIMTNDGPRIVEIGARNGGYRERMHQMANGIDITKNAIAVSLNEQPDITPTKNDHCAVIELFPKIPGIFKDIRHEAELRKLNSFRYLSIKVKPGEYTGKAADGYKMCAVTILHNTDTEVFTRELAYVKENVVVETN